MNVIIVDNGTSYIDHLTKLFAHDTCVVVHIDDIRLDSIAPGTLVVLSGGRTFPVAWHDKYYAKELDLIRHYDGPILGICLGFELIAHAYNHRLTRLPRRVHTERVITINEEGRHYFSQSHVTVFESHRYALRRARYPLVALGTTRNTIEIMRHATKPILAVQFHPEKFSGEQGTVFLDELLQVLEG